MQCDIKLVAGTGKPASSGSKRSRWNAIENILRARQNVATTNRISREDGGVRTDAKSNKSARHLPLIQPHVKRLVRDQPVPIEGKVTGKISMGVGGINSCVICRRWD